MFLFIETSIKYENIDTATNIPNQYDTNNLKKNIDESVSNVLHLFFLFLIIKIYKNLLYIYIFLYLFIYFFLFYFSIQITKIGYKMK